MIMNKSQCEQNAKNLAANMLRANADPLEMQYAVGQLMPLYERISEGEAGISRLEEELNRQKAKTEYEAERAGNIANDLDEAIEVIKGLMRANERLGLTVRRKAAHSAACDFLRKVAGGRAMARIRIAAQDRGKPGALKRAIGRALGDITVEEAALRERERCAQLAEHYTGGLRNGGAINACRAIARAIRGGA